MVPCQDKKSVMKRDREDVEHVSLRDRILDAAFTAFMEHGFAETSTLEIATRARVSKRELYEVIGNKEAMLVACISDRAKRLQVPVDLPLPRDRETLAGVLTGFGTHVLREVTEPPVIGAFRIAIAEALRTPAVAQALHTIGRGTARTALVKIMGAAHAARLVGGTPATMAEEFVALLWGDLFVNLLLRVLDPPSPREQARRARTATASFMRLYPQPE
jgi:AcrR family transcriptional regulator